MRRSLIAEACSPEVIKLVRSRPELLGYFARRRGRRLSALGDGGAMGRGTSTSPGAIIRPVDPRHADPINVEIMRAALVIAGSEVLHALTALSDTEGPADVTTARSSMTQAVIALRGAEMMITDGPRKIADMSRQDERQPCLQAEHTTNTPGPTTATELMQRIRAGRAELLRQQLAAEGEFVREADVAHRSGLLDWRGLLEIYDQLRNEGARGFARRWQEQIPYDRLTMRRFAEATSNSADGTWSGTTGWDGLDDGLIPARGTYVVYVLLDAGGAVRHVGMSSHLRAQLKHHHTSGLSWASWKAWPCADRHDALLKRKQKIAEYNEPTESHGRATDVGDRVNPAPPIT